MKTSDISVEYIQHCGDDLAVVNAARVSFDKESEWGEYFNDDFIEKKVLSLPDQRLIKYLATHGHISPFHHSFITMRIKAPIFVARQLVKHKFMPWNEVSRRYVDSEPEFFFPEHWRKKADNVKQGSSGEHPDNQMFKGVCSEFLKNAVATYENMIACGVAPEQARMVLPQNTMTEWVWSGTLSAWASVLNLRLPSSTQKETRDVAQKAYDILQPLFPVSIEALVHAY